MVFNNCSLHIVFSFFFFEWRKYPLNYGGHSLENGFKDFSKHTIIVFFIKYDRWIVNVDIHYTWEYETCSLNNIEKVLKIVWKSDCFFIIKNIENDYP